MWSPNRVLLMLPLAACTQSFDEAAPDGDQSALEQRFDPRDLIASDVSVLLPKPTTRAVLTAAEQGQRGTILPQRFLDKIPPLDKVEGNEAPPAADLKLVGVRLDPCTGVLATAPAGQCTSQVRLVFQRFTRAGAAHDGAVHAFYNVSPAELTGLALSMITSRKASRLTISPSAPLGVHPVVEQQGVTTGFAKDLRQNLLTIVGEQNLVRITFFAKTNGLPSGPWDFGFFEIADGTATRGVIATTGGATTQTVSGFNITNPSTLPEAKRAMDVDLLDDGPGLDAQLTLENPNMHSSESVACVECHRATVALDNRRAFAGDATLQSRPAAYRSSIPHRTIGANDDSTPTENFHVFSYFKRNAQVAGRVGTETAAVIERFRALYPASR